MGTRYNSLGEAVLTSTHNLCFEQKGEKYHSFLSENFQFLEVKFSIYLSRLVFVMQLVADLGAGGGVTSYILHSADACRIAPFFSTARYMISPIFRQKV